MKKNAVKLWAAAIRPDPFGVRNLNVSEVTGAIPNSADALACFEAAAPHDTARHFLRLIISGTTPCAKRAVVNTRRICEQPLQGCYELKMVHVARHVLLTDGEEIIAAPTLIKTLPLPLSCIVGHMSHKDKIFLRLDTSDTGAKTQ